MKATEENLATADADCVGSFVADTGYWSVERLTLETTAEATG